MPLNREIFREIVFRSMISFLCCITVGFVRYGTAIFSFWDHRFAIVAFGIIGSLFFFSLVKLERKHALFILFVLFMVNSLVLTKSFQHKFLFGDLLSVGALACAVYLFYLFVYSQDNVAHLFSPVILGALVGLLVFAARMFYVAITVLSGQRLFDFSFALEILRGVAVEFFVGLGIGIGILVSRLSLVNRSLKLT